MRADLSTFPLSCIANQTEVLSGVISEDLTGKVTFDQQEKVEV